MLHVKMLRFSQNKTQALDGTSREILKICTTFASLDNDLIHHEEEGKVLNFEELDVGKGCVLYIQMVLNLA